MNPQPPGEHGGVSPFAIMRRVRENLTAAQAEFERAAQAAMEHPDDLAALQTLKAAQARVAGARADYRAREGMRGAETTTPTITGSPLTRPQDRQGRLPKAVRDADGFRLRPDPLAAQTAAELVEALRLFRIWAGEPTYREMARRSGGRAAASTMNVALNDHQLPPQKVVVAVVIGCGGDENDQRDFITAWRRIRLSEEGVPSALDTRATLRVVSPPSETG